MSIVIEPDGRTIVELHPRRTLDLNIEKIDRVFQPADFVVIAVEHAVLDVAALVVRHQLAVCVLAHRLAGIGKALPLHVTRRRNEIERPAINRHLENLRWETRAFDHRFVVAGEKARHIAELGDARRQKVFFKKLFGAFGSRIALRRRVQRHGAAADRGQRWKHRTRIAGGTRHRDQRFAAIGEDLEALGVIVFLPAVEIVPGQRLNLAVGDSDRSGDFRMRRPPEFVERFVAAWLGGQSPSGRRNKRGRIFWRSFGRRLLRRSRRCRNRLGGRRLNCNGGLR